MKANLVKYLYKLAFYLSKDTELIKTVAKFVAEIEPRAAKAEQQPGARPITGERKRSWVLNNVTAALPNASARDIAFAIEAVIQAQEK
jgi:hypothetical protein